MNLMNRIRHFFTNKKSVGGSGIIKHERPLDDPRQFGFSNAPAEWINLREEHYRKWLGDLEKTLVWHEVLPVVPHIDIYMFPPSKELGRNFYTCISSGMSDEKMILPKGVDSQYSRAELIFYIAEGATNEGETVKPWFIEAISFLAHFPFDYKTWLAYSHTIPNGNPPIPVVEGSILTTAFLLPAVYESEAFVQDFKLGDEKVNFLWLTYLSDRETEYKLKYGPEKLFEDFTLENFPRVFNPFRRSIK